MDKQVFKNMRIALVDTEQSSPKRLLHSVVAERGLLCPYYGKELVVIENRPIYLRGKGPVEEVLYDAYYCPSCGAELYARWWSCEGYMHHISDYNIKDRSSGSGRHKTCTCAKLEEANAEFRKHAQSVKKQREQFYKSEASQRCPVCGGKYYSVSFHGNGSDLSKLQNMSISDSIRYVRNNSIEDRIFSYIRSQYAEECKDLFSKNLNHHLKEFKEALERKYGANSAITVCSNKKSLTTEQLKNYMLHLVQLETNIILSTEYWEKLVHQYYESNQQGTTVIDDALMNAWNAYQKEESAYNEAQNQLQQLKAEGPEWVEYGSYDYPEKPAVPQYNKPGLFNRKKVEAQNKIIEEQYTKAVEEYNKRCDKIKRKADADYLARKKNADDTYKKKIKTLESNLPIKKKKILAAKTALEAERKNLHTENLTAVMLEKKLSEAEGVLEKLYKARSELYALNIVFGKYRNLVALSTFYEYLVSGRCDSLEGANGAYNIYEAEVRSNQIISQLSDVRKSLSSIQNTQYTVYTQLQDINQTTKRLTQSMDAACKALTDIKKSSANIEKNSEVIAYNTAEAAHYAKVNANLTNALGFLVALK